MRRDAASSPRYRPCAVVFDVIETLFSLDRVADALQEVGQAPEVLDGFFLRLLRDGFALAALGEHRPFPDLAESALAVAVPGLTAAQRQTVLASFSTLEPHPDVLPALNRLRDAGVRAVALTNGSAANTEALMRTHQLIEFFEAIVSVDEAGVWKPRPEPYEHVVARVQLEPERVAMVAVHAWDLHGAARAGLTTGWASRLESTWSAVFTPPEVVGADLVEVIDGLLALPERPT